MLVMRFNTVQLLLEPLFRFLLQFLCFFQLLLKGGLFLFKKIDIMNFSQHISRKLLKMMTLDPGRVHLPEACLAWQISAFPPSFSLH